MNTYIKTFIIVLAVAFGLSVSAHDMVYENDLKVGSTGSGVKHLQSWLIENGFDIPAISKDKANAGYFGSQTRSAVAAYQLSVGLPNTGYFGPLTRAKVNKGDVTNMAFNIISPKGNEVWLAGSSQTIRWNAPQFIRATYVDINLVPDALESICPAGYSCLPDANYTIMRQRPISNIVKNVSIDNHSYTWNIPATGLFGDYIVQICQTGTSVCTESKSAFTINIASIPLSVTVVSPNGNENWTIGTTRTISWKLAGGMDSQTKVDIYLNREYQTPPCPTGSLCPAIIAPAPTIVLDKNKNIPSNAGYNWIVGTDIINNPISEGSYKIKICIVNGACDDSDNYFKLTR
jgi:peptidoglycan hydrolase-like protein with peptidoglycan-binding domain